MPSRPLPPAVRALLTDQDGVISRRQAVAGGLRPHDVERLLRRREWSRMAPGVFVDHTGPPTWRQRAWAAILPHWPAALYGASAMRAADGVTDDGGRILVVVDRDRSRPTTVRGVGVRRRSRYDAMVQPNARPPRQRYDEAALDTAAAAPDDLACVAVLAAACGTRRTTAARLLAALAARPRIARRRWLTAVLRDIGDGSCSVLEHGYLTRVEAAHGLPRGIRQQRDQSGDGVVYRDVAYDGRAVVELDGHAVHSTPEQHAADLERDLHHAAAGGATVRIGYRRSSATPARRRSASSASSAHAG